MTRRQQQTRPLVLIAELKMSNVTNPTQSHRQAFTLIEILVVIAIIGILMTLTVVAAMRALVTAKQAVIRTDIDVMTQSLEAYKLEYGDYPPDFSDWAIVERHFRKAFSNIDDRELLILSQFTHYNAAATRINTETAGLADPRVRADYDHYPHAIDRAEALVFCLGGYSSDKRNPFTGQGGPLVLLAGAVLPAAPTYTDFLLFQFNSERNAGHFPFDAERLTNTVYMAAPMPLVTTVPFVYSIDEGTAGPVALNPFGFSLYPDPFPVYRPSGKQMPFVYFSRSSYNYAFGAATAASWNAGGANNHHWQAVYLPAGGGPETGICRPYASNSVDTTPPAMIQGTAVTGTVLQFAESSKFQIISAGLDDNYGGIGVPGVGVGSGAVSVFPTGTYYNPFAAFVPAGPSGTITETDKYQDDDAFMDYFGGTAEVYFAQPQLDNITNFSTSTLENDLP